MKKYLASISGAILFGVIKTGQVLAVMDPLYGPPSYITKAYEDHINKINKIKGTINIFNIAFPIIVFIIGLIIILNKKIKNKIKIIVLSFLIILFILVTLFMNYYSNNIRKYSDFNEFWKNYSD